MTDGLLALGVTVIVECALAPLLLPRRTWIDRALIVLFVAGLNLVSHPLAWNVHAALPLPPDAAFLAVEGAVIVLEAVLLRCLPGVTVRRAVVAAIVLNATSAAVGLLMY